MTSSEKKPGCQADEETRVKEKIYFREQVEDFIKVPYEFLVELNGQTSQTQ